MDVMYAVFAGAKNCHAPCLEHLLLVPASMQATTGWPIYRLARRESSQQAIAAL